MEPVPGGNNYGLSSGIPQLLMVCRSQLQDALCSLLLLLGSVTNIAAPLQRADEEVMSRRSR